MKKKILMMLLFVITGSISAQICPFEDISITRWKTDNSGPSGDTQITLPLESSGTYDFIVNWGDSSFDTITTYNQSEVTHTYTNSGTYVVTIIGDLEGFGFNDQGDKEKILEIIQWGDLKLGNSGSYFYGCSNLIVTATDILNTNGITNMSKMFTNCDSITTIPNIEQWDMSGVTNINSMFKSTALYNQDLNNWDISNVTNIGSMFYQATSFNGNITSWDVSNVSTIYHMFNGASSFNQDISSWDVGHITNMTAMFSRASSFNQNISNWDVSSATTMNSMFNRCTSFDQDLGSWNISNVTNMVNMFYANAGGMSTANYDTTLIGWNTLDTGESQIPSNITLNGGTNTYCSSSTERDSLINTYGWTITDDGLNCPITNSVSVNRVMNLTEEESSLSLKYENDIVVVNNNDLILTILIYNLKGDLLKEIKNNSIGNVSIDVSDLSSGIYISKIITSSEVKTIRFIKE